MIYAHAKRLASKLTDREDLDFSEFLLPLTAFVGWWHGREPQHKLIVGTGFVIIIAGVLDLLLVLFNIPSWLFWPNDFLLIFGGMILIQIGLRYAVRSDQ